MKKKILTTALALFGAAGLISAAHAAPIAYQTGDIILGFEATTGVSNPATEDLLIDLGQYANFSSFSTFNIAADLNLAFGTNNWSSGQISFGAIGVTLASGTAHYADIYETGTSTLLPVATASQTTKQDYGTLTTGTYGYQTLTAYSNSWSGYGVSTLAANSGSWSSYQPQGLAFGKLENIETTIGSTLNFYDKIYGGSGTVASTPYTLSVDAQGNINIQAVPEPSTYALLGVSSLVLVVVYRRATA